MIRNNNYDAIGTTLASLSGAVKKENELIQKSDVKGQNDYKQLSSYLATIVYRQFQQLKFDFENEQINQARYVDYLRTVRNELTKDVVIDLPELHADEIVNEIKKYGLN